ncbi:MAG: DUF1223 domain-containing protein [Pyrinomonadaceae bacterium]
MNRVRLMIVVAVTAAGLLAFAYALAAQRREGAAKRDAAAAPHEAGTFDTSPAVTPFARTPVVVELFTSEGCSSCPPADDVLARFEREQPFAGVEVIALGQHVDYWNQLGWADPFSSRAFNERQYAYSGAFGRDGVYTPQMIVDGRAEFPGGSQSKAREAILGAARSPKASVSVALVSRADQQKGPDLSLDVRVEKLPEVSAGDEAEVLLALTESGLSTSVPRGENAGRTLGHAPVVRRLEMIGKAQAGAAFTVRTALIFDRGWKRRNLRAVVFVQERDSRRMLGAATVKLENE